MWTLCKEAIAIWTLCKYKEAIAMWTYLIVNS